MGPTLGGGGSRAKIRVVRPSGPDLVGEPQPGYPVGGPQGRQLGPQPHGRVPVDDQVAGAVVAGVAQDLVDAGVGQRHRGPLRLEVDDHAACDDPVAGRRVGRRSTPRPGAGRGEVGRVPPARRAPVELLDRGQSQASAGPRASPVAAHPTDSAACGPTAGSPSPRRGQVAGWTKKPARSPRQRTDCRNRRTTPDRRWRRRPHRQTREGKRQQQPRQPLIGDRVDDGRGHLADVGADDAEVAGGVLPGQRRQRPPPVDELEPVSSSAYSTESRSSRSARATASQASIEASCVLALSSHWPVLSCRYMT